MKRPLLVLAAAGSLLLALSAVDVALAQKAGGILKMCDPDSPVVCERVGMKIPVHPLHRLTFYFEIRERLERMPLTRHISRNVSFRPQGAGYICGNTTYD